MAEQLSCPCCDDPMVQRIFEPRLKMQMLERLEAPIHFWYCRACEYSVLCNKDGMVPRLIRWTGEIEVPPPPVCVPGLKEESRGTDALGNCRRCGRRIDSTTTGHCPHCDGGCP